MTQKEKLPAKFKAKWLAALRSGHFKQGKMKLYNEERDTYCCLGVACKIAGINPDDVYFPFNLLTAIDKLPKVLRQDSDGNGNIIDKLSEMNDDGKNFKTIANYIERHY